MSDIWLPLLQVQIPRWDEPAARAALRLRSRRNHGGHDTYTSQITESKINDKGAKLQNKFPQRINEYAQRDYKEPDCRLITNE